MTTFFEAATDGAIVAICTFFVAKAHEVAVATKRQHGRYLRLDWALAYEHMTHNIKAAVRISVVCGLTFAAIAYFDTLFGSG